MSMVATSASWGSFGSGVLRRDCRDNRADLMVRTGDHAEPRVSRQIAPCGRLVCYGLGKEEAPDLQFDC